MKTFEFNYGNKKTLAGSPEFTIGYHWNAVHGVPNYGYVYPWGSVDGTWSVYKDIYWPHVLDGMIESRPEADAAWFQSLEMSYVAYCIGEKAQPGITFDDAGKVVLPDTTLYNNLDAYQRGDTLFFPYVREGKSIAFNWNNPVVQRYCAEVIARTGERNGGRVFLDSTCPLYRDRYNATEAGRREYLLAFEFHKGEDWDMRFSRRQAELFHKVIKDATKINPGIRILFNGLSYAGSSFKKEFISKLMGDVPPHRNVIVGGLAEYSAPPSGIELDNLAKLPNFTKKLICIRQDDLDTSTIGCLTMAEGYFGGDIFVWYGRRYTDPEDCFNEFIPGSVKFFLFDDGKCATAWAIPFDVKRRVYLTVWDGYSGLTTL